MGMLSNYSNINSGGRGIFESTYDPTGVFTGEGLAGGQYGETGQFFADPLDLFGIRAGQTRNRLNEILQQSARENIALQESQLAEIERLTAPFRDAATGTALPSLSALAFGGDIDFQPSQLFQQQLESGREGILQQQSGGGAGVKSSNTFQRLSDLVSGLASEDMGRFEQGNLDLLNRGVTATNQLGQAGSQLTGNVGGIFSNLGQGLGQAERAFGQSRNASLQGLSSSLGGLSQLFATRS